MPSDIYPFHKKLFYKKHVFRDLFPITTFCTLSDKLTSKQFPKFGIKIFSASFF